jgi:predicted AAA+ superfamily ATPase
MIDLQQPLPRVIEPVLQDRLSRVPVVVITGARQTGKTTLVQRFPGASRRAYATLDSLTTLDRARQDPESLVASGEALTIDEVQRAPELLLAVKKEVDRGRRSGRFLLTGSANLLLMKSVADSLAGRASYLVLRPMTCREKRGQPQRAVWPGLLEAPDLRSALALLVEPGAQRWQHHALEGGYPPAVLASGEDDRQVWFEGYVRTYVERDLRDLAQVGDLGAFVRLLKLASLRVGGLLNQAELGRDARISRPTVQRWLSLLETTFLITLLQPFHGSRAKRIIKTPKLYAGDTGLGLYLADIENENDLGKLPNGGSWLENLLLNELLAWRETEIKKPGIFFRRTAGGEEVDFVIEKGRRLLPIEIKAASTLRVADGRSLEAFIEEFPSRTPLGAIIYDGREAFALTKNVLALPLGSLL